MTSFPRAPSPGWPSAPSASISGAAADGIPVHGCVVTGQRYRLPRGSDGVEQLHVEAIGAGWCELSEEAPILRLPFDRVRVGDRGRFRLPDAPGYGQRWACSEDEPILIVACPDPATGAAQVLLLAVGRILAGLDGLRPPLSVAHLRPQGRASASETADVPPTVPPRNPPNVDVAPGGSDGS